MVHVRVYLLPFLFSSFLSVPFFFQRQFFRAAGRVIALSLVTGAPVGLLLPEAAWAVLLVSRTGDVFTAYWLHVGDNIAFQRLRRRVFKSASCLFIAH